MFMAASEQKRASSRYHFVANLIVYCKWFKSGTILRNLVKIDTFCYCLLIISYHFFIILLLKIHL